MNIHFEHYRDVEINVITVNCRWGPYRSWSQCTATCGGRGTQKRDRLVAQPASGGGRPCSGGHEQHRSCNNQRCLYNALDVLISLMTL